MENFLTGSSYHLKHYRILLFCLLCLFRTTGAYAWQSADPRLSIRFEKEDLFSCLKKLETTTGMSFYYQPSELKAVNSKITFVFTNQPLSGILDKVLRPNGFSWQWMNGRIAIRKTTAEDAQQHRQQLRIAGKVLDNNKTPLPGVTIRMKGSQTGVISDGNGLFAMAVPMEGGVLQCSNMGYKMQEVAVNAASGSLIIVLQATSSTLSEVTVQARRHTNTEIAVLDERRRSAIVQDAISAQQIERTASITTTQALQRVAGVTVTDDKYVAVRGLGDRSVIGQLNGVRLASSDPDKSAIPLDLVPASLLDNITIYKTVTPDKPADAAAGIVELKTKSVPDSLTLEVVVQTGYNSNVAGGSYNSFWNSEMGFLGNRINHKNLSPAFKALAQEYPDGPDGIQKMVQNSHYSIDGWKEVNRVNGIMQGFDPVMSTRYRKAPLNQLYSATYGNRFTVFKKHQLGVILGGNYYHRITDIRGGDLTQYSIYQGVVTGNPDIYSFRNIPNYITSNSLYMGRYQTYKENTGTETLNYGVLSGLTYRFSPRHEISMQYMGSWGGENVATHMQGRYEYTGLPGEVGSTIYSLKQSYRTLNTFNLQGEHKFLPGAYSPRLSYNVATSRSGQNNPDYRFLSMADYTPKGGGWYKRPALSGENGERYVYTKHLYALTSGYVNGFGAYGTIQAEPNGRRWRQLDEVNYNYKVDLALPFKLLGQRQEFKTGVNYLFRDRTFRENQLLLPGSNFNRDKAIPLYDAEGNPDRLVGNDIVGVKLSTGQQGDGMAPVSGFMYNSRKSPNNYSGYYETNAFYGMVDLQLTEQLRVAGGVRFEMTDIGSAVDTADVFLDPALTVPGSGGGKTPLVPSEPNAAYKTGYKPYYSANLTYTLNRNMNFRAAFNTTLARPELREITNVFEFDAFQMGLVVGNPGLVNQYTENLDFRWEWFPNRGEVIAVSLFGKQIKNQLVKVFNLKTDGLAATYPEFPTIQFQNDPNIGRVWGIELEIVKDLGRWWDPLTNFFLGSNLLLAQSDIKKSAERYTANRSLDRYTPKNSPLFEQAPYSVNAWLNYNNKKTGTDLTATFNMVGERLIQINLTGEPDLFTQPVPVLDFVLSQQLSKRIFFKGYAKNVLNPAVKTVYANAGTGGKWYGNEYINRSYKRGAEMMLGFTYKLF
ncbi:carboxypeptidase-like regulatory domain-containing protein [Chitinophaga nivalis]|uniref:Carboxypeptidase-like regulatory domain-containing protein n=1 Tax=Chitinophaga nivalis TaxID=2991709 RepID=A0ABT3IJE0_9BACT|nr:carboxypeptidase-like regulatory domain-containing protein [Chitinophaga nivalis]MCW3466384.1 carboxypeptidase-like regulatory domain-containing protein [Chitinophaga nivalis]MCW3483925.1 carboxypeptidase-like regulatory domain-containing protein [Chitinophaga nivalis]